MTGVRTTRKIRPINVESFTSAAAPIRAFRDSSRARLTPVPWSLPGVRRYLRSSTRACMVCRCCSAARKCAMEAVLEVEVAAPGHHMGEQVAVEGGVLLQQRLEVQRPLGGDKLVERTWCGAMAAHCFWT